MLLSPTAVSVIVKGAMPLLYCHCLIYGHHCQRDHDCKREKWLLKIFERLILKFDEEEIPSLDRAQLWSSYIAF